ncbi:ATP-binding protein [Dactylosporangium fulvum]|uniref:ATP-binding protein n=1 Tax=Dactylosporangium fulvum TaxID=53359 RepID=A0ABY5W9F2_9ACTN|nr:ATP-binding protein [Dactylosporangium fulvum]UWP85941.1 ATP-binding protein [Dactylosporangium fulvum]
MPLKTRKPTGLVPWPLILVEGSEKSGKSWSAAALSASDRVGRTFWIDLGEGAADEYGAIPGARYEIVEHDGTWASIFGAVVEVRDVAAQAAKVGDKPVVLVIDSMTAEWDLLKDWISNRARQRAEEKAKKYNRRLDADKDPQISMDLWNEANGRHRKLMTILMTFPGIVIVTARGKEVAALDSNGRPIEGSKEYKVEGQKNLAFDATVWLRMSRTEPPTIIGARSVHAGIRPGTDAPRGAKGLTLERLIFDVLKCNPAQAQPRDLVEVKPGSEEPDQPQAEPETQPARSGRAQRPAVVKPSPKAVELLGAITTAKDLDALKATWEQVQPALSAGEVTQAEADQLNAHVKTRKGELGGDNPTSAPPVQIDEAARKRSMARMHAQWSELGLGGDAKRDERLQRTSAVVGRAITSSSDLTDAEIARVIAWQADQKAEQTAEAAA